MADNWKNLDKAFDELEEECSQIVRGLTVRIWNGILSKTPQWAGRMVSSYNYRLNSPVYEDRSSLYADETFQVGTEPDAYALWPGHRVAIAVANAENAYRDANFRLGDKVYITNGVDHGEGPYSQAVEDESTRLRSPGRMAARTLDWVSVNYRSISRAQGQTLKGYGIGR